jgi:hypothetical protein
VKALRAKRVEKYRLKMASTGEESKQTIYDGMSEAAATHEDDETKEPMLKRAYDATGERLEVTAEILTNAVESVFGAVSADRSPDGQSSIGAHSIVETSEGM